MKYCPNCQTTYADVTLQFCLQDGTGLLSYSGKTSQMPTQVFGELETIVKQNRMPSAWEQSQVTRVATLQPEAKKSNTAIAVILTAFVMVVFFGSVLGFWLFLRVPDSEVKVVADVPENNSFRISSDANSSIHIESNNKSSGEIPNSVPPKGVSLGGEALKACEHFIGSGLYDKWKQMGGEKGKLGCPVMNEAEAPRSPQGTTGRYTHFSKGDGGYIIWHGSGRYSGTAFEVNGCFFKLYKSINATRSWLGFPIADAHAVKGGSRQDFEGGYMQWNSQTGECQAIESSRK